MTKNEVGIGEKYIKGLVKLYFICSLDLFFYIIKEDNTFLYKICPKFNFGKVSLWHRDIKYYVRLFISNYYNQFIWYLCGKKIFFNK